MNCVPVLADTGFGGSVLLVLVVGLVGLVLGLGMVLRARRGRGREAVGLTAVILVLAAGATLAHAPSPASAAPSACESSTETPSAPEDNSLSLTQTSVMVDLAPHRAPVPITGLVVNNGADSTFVTAVRVEIVGVTRAPGSAAGPCDASDYVLLAPRMSVGRTLGPWGGSSTFSGASIGFANKSSNQDACQGATVQLGYRTVAA